MKRSRQFSKTQHKSNNNTPKDGNNSLSVDFTNKKKKRMDWENVKLDQEEISSDEEIENDHQFDGKEDQNVDISSHASNAQNESSESAAQKRIRLAKKILQKLGENDDDDRDNEDMQNELYESRDHQRMSHDGKAYLQETEKGFLKQDDDITKKLQDKYLLSQGQLRSPIAEMMEKLNQLSSDETALTDIVQYSTIQSSHCYPITCFVYSQVHETLYMGCKSGDLFMWEIGNIFLEKDSSNGKPNQSKRKKSFRLLKKVEGIHRRYSILKSEQGKKVPDDCHVGDILALAMSSDEKYLASGGEDYNVRIWNPRNLSLIACFPGHRDSITCLSFQQKSPILLSGSYDRSVRVWNVADRTFIESLFGHQDQITDLDVFVRERAVTSSVDRTVRFWKRPEESHLILGPSGNKFSVDCVCMVDEVHFVSGTQDGALSLWHTSRRKPMHTIPNAHGIGKWITTVTCLRNSNLIATGSNSGCIKLWKVSFDVKELSQTAVASFFNVPGYVNKIQLKIATSKSELDLKVLKIVAAVSREHRLGRWDVFSHQVCEGIHFWAVDLLKIEQYWNQSSLKQS